MLLLFSRHSIEKRSKCNDFNLRWTTVWLIKGYTEILKPFYFQGWSPQLKYFRCSCKLLPRYKKKKKENCKVVSTDNNRFLTWSRLNVALPVRSACPSKSSKKWKPLLAQAHVPGPCRQSLSRLFQHKTIGNIVNPVESGPLPWQFTSTNLYSFSVRLSDRVWGPEVRGSRSLGLRSFFWYIEGKLVLMWCLLKQFSTPVLVNIYHYSPPLRWSTVK